MKTLRSVGLVLILVALTALPAMANGTTVTTNEKIPIDLFVWVPCAGEWIHLSGNLHVVHHVTWDANGGYHYAAHFQPQSLSGYGMLSGLKYQGTGVTRYNTNLRPDGYPYEHTYVNNFRMIGQGPGNNYLVHETFHITINANGEVTAYVDNFSVDCK
jgi:hypothetical protein